MALVRWEPVRELNSLQSEMNRLFNTFFDTPAPAGNGGALRRWMPAMDLVETEDHFVLRADLPGLDEDDVKIELEDNVLTISGERKSEHEEQQGGLLPRRARVRRVLALADPARGRRRRRAERQLRQAACSRSASRSPSSASRAASRIGLGGRQAGDRGPRPGRAGFRRLAPTHRSATAGPARARARSACQARARVAPFEIHAPRPRSRARAGVLHLAHGDGPHARLRPAGHQGRPSSASSPPRCAALGYDMVLGNTFHLFLAPGHELIAQLGGLHAFMRWERPIITDSGGFQVFSMGHGTVADEIKGRAPHGRRARGRDPRDRGGGRALPLLPRRLASASWRPRPRWRSRPRWAPTSRSCSTSARRSTSTRDYTARSTERTHRWLDRCLRLARRARPGRPAGLRDRPGRRRRGPAPRVGAGGRRARRRAGSRSAARWARTSRRCTRSSSGRSPSCRRTRPRHLLGIGDIDDLIRGVELGHRHLRLRDADAPGPPRHGGRARPGARWRVDLAKARWRARRRAAHARAARARPARAATPAATCTTCSRRREPTGAAAADAAQPRLPAAADGRPARRRRRGPAGRGAAAARAGAAPWELSARSRGRCPEVWIGPESSTRRSGAVGCACALVRPGRGALHQRAGSPISGERGRRRLQRAASERCVARRDQVASAGRSRACGVDGLRSTPLWRRDGDRHAATPAAGRRRPRRAGAARGSAPARARLPGRRGAARQRAARRPRRGSSVRRRDVGSPRWPTRSRRPAPGRSPRRPSRSASPISSARRVARARVRAPARA